MKKFKHFFCDWISDLLPKRNIERETDGDRDRETERQRERDRERERWQKIV